MLYGPVAHTATQGLCKSNGNVKKVDSVQSLTLTLSLDYWGVEFHSTQLILCMTYFASFGGLFVASFQDQSTSANYLNPKIEKKEKKKHPHML